jgi:hypothetical protein
MSWLRSYHIPEPTSEHIQLLMERFARARWIDRSIVTPDPIAIAWSQRGRERMGVVHSIVKALVPPLFDASAPRCGQLASVKHMWRLTWATLELRWPPMRRREESALLAIAASLELAPDGLPTPIYTIRQGS